MITKMAKAGPMKPVTDDRIGRYFNLASYGSRNLREEKGSGIRDL